jgi:hypothetical protein
MRNGQHSNRRRRPDVDNLVRETFDWRASHGKVGGYARHERACTGKADDLFQGSVDGIKEFGAQSGPLLFVPTCSSAVFLVRLVLKPDCRASPLT